ncbi:hypothetical protein [Silvimonas iriomotensis]|uniref:Uncharacterized protein n=1 Tax=Silvimonas iriomotensis TaxID=449662 RepID=A0ABQ2P6M0_9NEIS|nr:hypothetical protein [Silvimonas iriomotensis]GGP18951.1 hypothetical protein GCM10010970_08200 [Silvimonas iriomotensis]
MNHFHIRYQTWLGEKAFSYDFGVDLPWARVDSLVLEAVIQNEFPEDIALRRIVDFPLGEKPQRETIEAVMGRFSLRNIEFQVAGETHKIRAKHPFHL